MARKCYVTGLGTVSGNNRPHSLHVSKRTWKANLQKVRIKDEDGKIIVDLEHPHILENMDYFRKTAIFFEEHGYYTDLKPNPNPNSEYYKWVKEEVRRCHEGMIRPSDGEWIPGDLYFYWNYTEIQLAEKTNSKSRKALRLYKMPKVWDGTYWYFHYLHQAREAGEHGCMLSSRSKGKSFSAAAMLAKRFKLGETPENDKGCTCYITASEKKFLVAGDQTLDKFQHDIDFISQKTEWPGRELLVNRLNDMMWTAGYKDLIYGNVGTGNSVVGITSKNDVEKLRGTRAVLYVLEEAGTFKGLDSVWQNILPSVEEGKGDERNVFGQIVCFGTSGDEESDFQSLAKMMYHPRGYHIKALANIYDIKGKGGSEFSYFFPAYLNNANCYDKDGNSDITKSLLEILKDRIYTKTHSGNDLNALTKTIAENPIVPQEAILRAKGNFFPTAQINERINELQQHPDLLNEIVTGDLVQQSDGSVKYVMTSKEPIRQYPLPNDFNNLEGAIEFYQMPQKDKDGKVYSNRYIAGYDPIDDDAASSTLSLNSIFVLDLWTDEIVCEWTGRFAYADDCYERVRLIALFYNAMILAENNKKGYYSYFAARNCAETLLAEAPDYLKDRNLVQLGLYGNKAKGYSATNPLNNLANQMIRTWLTKPKTIVVEKEDGTVEEVSVTNLSKLRAMALLRELAQYNIDDNFDRIRALGAVMLYREQFNILYEGDVTKSQLNAYKKKNKLANDKFFTRNYDNRFSKFSKKLENI